MDEETIKEIRNRLFFIKQVKLVLAEWSERDTLDDEEQFIYQAFNNIIKIESKYSTILKNYLENKLN